MTTSPLEPGHLRSCLSRFVTGVAVVSYRTEGEIRGLTVNSFTSVSLDPPLILVSLARRAKAAEFLNSVPFTINVLQASQHDVAMQFAGRPREGFRMEWQEGGEEDLAPSLVGALATFRCRPWQSYDGGDHVLQIGEVIEAEVSNSHNEPLLFDRGQFAMVGLNLFDHPRILDAPPIVGGGIVRNHLVHQLAAS